MVDVLKPAAGGRLEALDERMARSSLAGHWQPRKKISDLQPWLWRWQDIYECLMESGEIVKLGEDTNRRTVQLINPALAEQKSTTRTIQMSVQLVNPGEIAECHRHTAAALRFVVQGQGAYTVVEGERMVMAPGDLVLTPNWTWHDHANLTAEPIVWLDVLDIHLARHLDAQFQELHELQSQEITKPDGASRWAFGLTRTTSQPSGNAAPPYNYKWKDTLRALEALAGGPGDPHDGLLLEYKNPLTGGHTMPTINCRIQMLRPGEITQAHRHTSTKICQAVRGQGVTIVDDKELSWNEKDCFTVPSWRWHEHRNLSKTEPAIVFSVSDLPVLEVLGLYREEGQEARES